MPMMNADWYCEAWEERTAFAVRVTSKLYDAVTEFQSIEVFDSEALGRILVLNDCFMVTQKDHFVYHEMLVHTPMAVVPDPRNLLIIGGGDGGAVTEAIKYPHLESITLCEIDPQVVSTCKEFFPDVSAGLSDPRVRVVYEDGAAFVRDSPNKFDIILVDSTDPVGPATALFSKNFFANVRDCLTESGTAVFQTESPFFMEHTFNMVVQDLTDVFGSGRVHPYVIPVPTYPGGLWSLTFCSKTLHPLNVSHRETPDYLEGRLRYYDPDVHRAAFTLPVFVRKLLRSATTAGL